MENTHLNNTQIEAIIDNVERILMHQQKLQFAYETDWNDSFPKKAGVYAAFENDELIYIGQTADLKSRMSDVRRTYNHTLRKKLGLDRLKGTIIKNKFSDEIEEKLTAYMVKNISFSHCAIAFGRLEIEFKLVQKHKEILINSNNVRGVKK
jgi:hypothetical protein